MGKIVDTTYNPTSYELVTQTPKNYKKDNYFIETLQEKVWADWEYRPNRVDVEQEGHFGEDDYFPLEVVIQNIKSDKGEKVSDDYKRLVFRDIQYKVGIGAKFRFSYNFDLEEPDEEKDVWLVTNRDSTVPTSAVAVSRCNGTIGSIYIDENNKSSYRYEPVICTSDLRSVGITLTQTIMTANAQIYMVVQHNKYTKQYYLNQRFIVGYNKVYKVTGVYNFNSQKTYKPEAAGTMILYAELDEISPKDNFETRIAFNKEGEQVPETPKEPIVGNYSLQIYQPDVIPTELYSTPIQFSVGLFNGTEQISIPIQIDVSLSGTSNAENYYELVVESETSFTLRRRKIYNRAPLTVKCYVPATESPTEEELAISFEMSLRGLE